MNIRPLRREAAPPPERLTTCEPAACSHADALFRAPLERLLQAVVALAGARGAAVRHLERDTHRLRLIGTVGLPPEAWDDAHSVPDGCGVCGEALRRADIRESAEACACSSQIAPAGSGPLRVCVLPLHDGGTVRGVLNLFLPADRELPATLAPLLEALGDMLGLALENANLMQKNLEAGLMHERQMLAGEVHDSLAQNLTWMRMRTALLHDAIARHDDGRAFRYLNEMEDALALSHRRVRELITHFRSQLDPHGLLHALREAASGLQEVGNVEFQLDNRIENLDLSPEQERQVFHVVAEALANIMKHAQARHCRMLLEERPGQYVFTVEDDGIGLAACGDAVPESGHYGLNIMRERVNRLGGRIEFQSAAGQGTRIQLCIPAATPRTEAS